MTVNTALTPVTYKLNLYVLIIFKLNKSWIYMHIVMLLTHWLFSSVAGIVVEDCLILLLNLLKNNTSNQNFFREGSHIKYLTPFFDFEQDQQRAQVGWSAQKVTNIHLLLQVYHPVAFTVVRDSGIVFCLKMSNKLLWLLKKSSNEPENSVSLSFMVFFYWHESTTAFRL